MAYPAYLTDVRSPSDGYLFWPEWMKTLFLDGMGWSIKELFWHWLGVGRPHCARPAVSGALPEEAGDAL